MTQILLFLILAVLYPPILWAIPVFIVLFYILLKFADKEELERQSFYSTLGKNRQ